MVVKKRDARKTHKLKWPKVIFRAYLVVFSFNKKENGVCECYIIGQGRVQGQRGERPKILKREIAG